MSNKTIMSGILVDNSSTYSYVEVCEKYNISEKLLVDMLEHGLFSSHITHIHSVEFDQKMLGRIQAACRLQRDLDINMPGIVLALELLDELSTVRDELTILRRHIESSV